MATITTMFRGARRRTRSPEQRLMAAVLDDALEVMRTRGFGHRMLAEDTEQWFFSSDLAWPFSFHNVCAALGVDPVAIRQTVEGLRRPRRAAA